MRTLASLLVIAGLAACGGGGGSVTAPQVGSAACENDGQKQFVLDNLYAWYLWNDLLPADIDINDYASPEELIVGVTQDFGPGTPVISPSTVSASCVPCSPTGNFSMKVRSARSSV